MDKNKTVFARCLIDGIEGYCFGSDKNLYRLPFSSGKNHYGLRKLKKQHPNRWKINGQWWSERQLLSKIYRNPEVQVLINYEDCPF
jgi:hypothetical protein